MRFDSRRGRTGSFPLFSKRITKAGVNEAVDITLVFVSGSVCSGSCGCGGRINVGGGGGFVRS